LCPEKGKEKENNENKIKKKDPFREKTVRISLKRLLLNIEKKKTERKELQNPN